MEDSGSSAPTAGSGQPDVPKRKRQERTVYKPHQQEVLRHFFAENQYPSHLQRLELAYQLNLQEHQVQVWFKNHRAKMARLSRNRAQHGEPRVGPEPRDPEDQRPALVALQLEVPQLEGPQMVDPQIEAPQMEAHQMEAPQMGAPQIEAPQMGAPQMEAPQMGAPHLEGPPLSGAPDSHNLRAAISDSTPCQGPMFSRAPAFFNPRAPAFFNPTRNFSYPEYPNLCNGPRSSASFCEEPSLGPSRNFSGDLLGSSAGFSGQHPLEISRSYSGNYLLGPSASLAQENLYPYRGDQASYPYSREPVWGCVQTGPTPAPAQQEDPYDPALFSGSFFTPNFGSVFEFSRPSGYLEEEEESKENSQGPKLLEL